MRIHARVTDDLGRLFKKRVKEVYGTKKGAISLAIEEAIVLWLTYTDYSKVRKNVYSGGEEEKEDKN